MIVKGFIKKILDWWGPYESFFSGFVLPLLCVVLSVSYIEAFLNDACNEVVKNFLLKARIPLAYTVFFCAIAATFLSFLNKINGAKSSTLKEKLKLAETEILAKNELLQNNIRAIFDGVLINIHTAIDNSDNNTRISLYHCCNENNFIMIGRFCPNPKFNAVGRGLYPQGEGLITEGWEQGWIFEDFGDNAHEERKQIFRDKYSITALEKLSMIPVQIAVLRLTMTIDIPIPSKKHLGVIVVETMQSGLCQAQELRSVLEKQSHYLATMIKILQDFIPSPKAAASIEEG